MNYEVMKQWTEALRSGNYKQGKRRLRLNDKFCCLGVLCDISGLGEWKDRRGGFGLEKEPAYYLQSYSTLPDEVMEWAGMENQCGLIEGFASLGTLNDLVGYSFEDIANIIEESWEKL
jgi:hypothetical protein